MTEFPSMNMYPMHINEREDTDQTVWLCITKTRLFKYIEIFTTKTGKFSDKKF